MQSKFYPLPSEHQDGRGTDREPRPQTALCIYLTRTHERTPHSDSQSGGDKGRCVCVSVCLRCNVIF